MIGIFRRIGWNELLDSLAKVIRNIHRSIFIFGGATPQKAGHGGLVRRLFFKR
jgi:hypothetical protein